MHIFLKVGDDGTYTNHQFKGHFALELTILTVIEVYFGREIRLEVESILKSKLAEEEIIKNIKSFRDLRINGRRK